MTITGTTQIKDKTPVSVIVNGTPSVSLGETPKLTTVETKTETTEKQRFVKKK